MFYSGVGLTVACDCGISGSYSLTMMWVGLSSVIVVFPCHTYSL